MNIHALLGGNRPTTREEIQQLHGKVDTALKMLQKMANTPGVHGQPIRDIIDVVRDDFVEQHAGVSDWLPRTAEDLKGLDDLDVEDRVALFRYFGEEMEEYRDGVNYCLERIAELLSPDEG